MKLKKSSRVALGGVVSSLCILIMLMTGFFPFLTYAAPLCAGFLLIAVIVDCGYSWAFLVYLVVALLSVFIVPDKQAAVIFLFFGYYPIVKSFLDQHLKSRILRIVIKFAIFNISIIVAYLLMIYVFMMPDVMTEIEGLGKFTWLVTLIAGNLLFLMFEFALNRVFYFYRNYFRPHFLRKVK